MKDNDLITRREVELVLLEKGQETGRYKWGEQWELNFSEIREALAEYQPKLVRCMDCKNRPDEHTTELDGKLYRYCELHRRWTTDDWFCADGERKERR